MSHNNTIENQYLSLIKEILETGNKKQTRNGGVISLFGRTLRHNFKDGFPAFTTKKLAWKQVVGELLWMLSGSTNIKPMVDQGNYIWVGDAYRKYVDTHEKYEWTDEFCEQNLKDLGDQWDTVSKEEFIDRIKTNSNFANKWAELGPVYGAQWRKYSGATYMPYPGEGETPDQRWYRMGNNSVANNTVDQVSNIIHLLKTDPDSRRMLVSAWNPLVLHKVTLPPCHYSWQVYTRELTWYERAEIAGFMEGEKEVLRRSYIYKSNLKGHKFYKLFRETDTIEQIFDKLNIPTRSISLMWTQRSGDALLGIPFNVSSYGLLLNILAKAVNMVPDELMCSLVDVHIYNDHIEGAKEQIQREPYPFPTLNMNTEKWDMSSVDSLVNTMAIEDFVLLDYKHHPKIHFPLSN